MPVVVGSCVVGLSQLLLTVFWLFRSGVNSLAEKLFVLFLIASGAYILNGIVVSQTVSIALTALYTATPALFWMLCGALFNDNFKLRSWHLSGLALTTVLPLAHQLLKPTSDVSRFILVAMPQMLEYGLILMGLIITVSYWKDDLVEERRALRACTIVVMGVYLLGAVGSQQFFGHNEWWVSSGSYVIAAAIATVLNLYLGGLKKNTLFAVSKPVTAVIPIYESDDLKATLKQKMEQGIYRKAGLTIGELAAQIEIQEHNLRRLINHQLGYRNFNDFLNSYRVEEAARKLKEGDSPIITIALEAGFGSLTSFNQAFKLTFGMTPTQHRRQSLATDEVL